MHSLHPSYLSDDLGCMQADLSKRFGNLSGGVSDIKTHPWFRTVDWEACLARRASPPIKYAAVRLVVSCACSIQAVVGS